MAMLAGGCSKSEIPAQSSLQTSQLYVIGLGEIMGQTQDRHAKLWFAGRAGNRPMVTYELDELKKGFDDAVKYHPHHKSVCV